MREAENKKRQLEEAADALREECARLQVILTYIYNDFLRNFSMLCFIKKVLQWKRIDTSSKLFLTQERGTECING